MSEVSKDPLRRSLRALTHGVYVLSTSHASSDAGSDDFLIVSLATQCSVEPPRVALALSVNARILSPFRSANGGVLSILAGSDIAAVRRYGAPGGVRHPPTDCARGTNGHPVPPEASFAIELQIVSEQAVGDHVLFVCDATGATARADTSFAPLTLQSSGFPYAG
jgi:flavin reductase (DIM6/NTAB) family NADH-FMN oxidoreductase RutF